MPALHGRAAWPGLRGGVISATYTCSHGGTAGVATLAVPMQDVGGLAPRGTLVLYDGLNRPVRLRDCLLGPVSLTDARDRLILHVFDRRWQWRFGRVSGWYNQQDPHPDPRPPGDFLARPGEGGDGYIPGTERTPVQLMTLCLRAMGERFGVLFGAVPGDARPAADWAAVRPLDALQAVADQVGCRVVFQPNRDGVFVTPPSAPTDAVALPVGPVLNESLSADPPAPPSAITVVGGAALVGDFWRLEYVGLEADGRVLPIDELSYKPPRGWWAYVPGFGHWADCVKGDSESVDQSKALAKQFVWRTFRLAGRLADAPAPAGAPKWQVPLPRLVRLTHPRQVTLLPDYYSPDKDRFGRFVSAPGKLYADSYNYTGDRQLRGKNYAVPTELDDSFQLDARGLVTSARPIFRAVTGAAAAELVDDAFQAAQRLWRTQPAKFDQPKEADYAVPTGWVTGPAAVYLRASARVRDPDTWAEVRGEWTRRLAGGDAPAETVLRPELVPVYGMQRFPDQGFRLQAVNSNLDDLAAAAAYYLDAAARKYRVKPALTRTYAGLVPVDPDGAIEQVTWEFSTNGPPTTTVSVGTEHSAYLPPYPERRRAEAVAAFLSRDWVNSVLGVYQPKGGG